MGNAGAVHFELEQAATEISESVDGVRAWYVSVILSFQAWLACLLVGVCGRLVVRRGKVSEAILLFMMGHRYRGRRWISVPFGHTNSSGQLGTF